METRLTVEQVCSDFEFAEWELHELIERGALIVDRDEQGRLWFDSAEIMRFLRENHYLISMDLADFISGKSERTLRHQARKGKLKAKKVGNAWATTVKQLDEYLDKYARNG